MPTFMRDEPTRKTAKGKLPGRGPRAPETCKKIGKTMRDGYASGRLFKRFGGRGA